MKIFDCNNKCEYCTAIFCEGRSKYIKTEQTNKTEEKYKRQ